MIPSFSIGWPRIFLIPVRFKTALRGVAPRRRMYLGLTFAISVCSQTEQAFISATFGDRFPGGRHVTVFVMHTFRLFIPAPFSILFKSFPESPTKGFPSSSSVTPGASPITITSQGTGPTPIKHTVLQVSWRGHLVQLGSPVILLIIRPPKPGAVGTRAEHMGRS